MAWIDSLDLTGGAHYIIHCCRNPVDTCLSIYFTHFGVAKDCDYDRTNIAAFYQGHDRLMADWRRVLPRHHFAEVDYEDLAANRDAVARRLIAFCGVPWDDVVRRLRMRSISGQSATESFFRVNQIMIGHCMPEFEFDEFSEALRRLIEACELPQRHR